MLLIPVSGFVRTFNAVFHYATYCRLQFPLFLNVGKKHFRLVFSSLFESRFAHKICFPLSPSLHCQRLFSTLLAFTTLSHLVLNALDVFFATGHSDEWRLTDISEKVALSTPGRTNRGVITGPYKISRSSGSVRVCGEWPIGLSPSAHQPLPDLHNGPR